MPHSKSKAWKTAIIDCDEWRVIGTDQAEDIGASDPGGGWTEYLALTRRIIAFCDENTNIDGSPLLRFYWAARSQRHPSARTGPRVPAARLRRLWRAALDVLDRLFEIATQTKQRSPAPTGTWFHTPDEKRPDLFFLGPLTDTQINLNYCVGGKLDRNALQLHAKGRQGKAWIVKRDRTTYEIWFKTQGEKDAAKRRAETLKTLVAKKKTLRK